MRHTSINFKSINRMMNTEPNIVPKTIGILGYGAIGKAFVDILTENHPGILLITQNSESLLEMFMI